MLSVKNFICFHGTTQDAIPSIMNKGFKLSSSNEDWLGHGVYFFIRGISNPLKNAAEWAKNKSKNKNTCVIKATVKLNEFEILDLRTTKGQNDYNKHREKIVHEYYDDLLIRRDLNIKKRKDMRVDDCIINSILLHKVKYKAIIHNVYIKNSLQRNLVLESSYPNSTVLCVNDLSKIEIIDIIKN
ncbi:hypothetical protein CEP63_016255 [Proteus mirabilis]|nr:hypothetical protein CEP63_016255 [Proteus mirabilis]